MGLKMGAASSTAGRGILSDIHHRIQCARFIPAGAGTRRKIFMMGWLWRFIPAGAGNSGPPCSHLPNFPVYPRWRGELNMSFVNFGAINGLSPLARELYINEVNLWKLYGLSPLARGTR